jgi:8-oxo-dGTP pyrophosphatase MutT (NUDIX family)
LAVPPFFDPRLVPIVGAGTDLPKINAQALSPSALEQRFVSPPIWTPELVSEASMVARTPVHAAVLIPLVMRAQLMVLLTERTAHLSSHSGQVAFPGGKVDAQDHDSAATALREAQEEVGLEPHFVQVLGTLPTYTTGSAYVVTPVVGLVRADFDLAPNPHEVADVFEVPLAFLMDPANHRRHAVEWDGHRREWLSMPYMDDGKERFIWGATAGMIRNLYRFLQAGSL